MTEMQSLKSIVESQFGIDIMKRRRERKNVEARMVYSKILRDRGYTLKSIGDFLGRDHSTIVHYVSIVDFLLKQDNVLLERYIKCKSDFFIDHGDIARRMTEGELLKMINSLTEKLDSMLIERDRVMEISKKNSRFELIIDLLNEKIPEGEEKAFERKLNQMFNEQY